MNNIEVPTAVVPIDLLVRITEALDYSEEVHDDPFFSCKISTEIKKILDNYGWSRDAK